MIMRPVTLPALLPPALLVLAACTGTGAIHPPARDSAAPIASVVHAASAPLRVGELDSLIRRTVAEKRLVGLSVGVAQDGKIVFAKGYGLAALDARDSVTPETMFGIGSVT